MTESNADATPAVAGDPAEDATHLPEPGKVWHRYVAIGDSFTEGMSDPDPEHPGR